MKPTVILLAGIALISACRSTKEQFTQKENRYAEAKASYQSLYTWHRMDCTGRYWQYMGDTSFYYHPDSGFYAHGGTFRLYESVLKSSKDALLSVGQRKKVQQEQRADSSKKTSGSGAIRWVAFLVAVLLLLSLVRVLRKEGFVPKKPG